MYFRRMDAILGNDFSNEPAMQQGDSNSLPSIAFHAT
jgi:hypothetical protein